MAATKRERNGVYSAVWWSRGKQISMTTGESLLERAILKAAAMEAEARFWEDHCEGVWQRMADASFSPRYLHAVFVGRAHLPFPAFKKLLAEADVKFKPPGSWRDRTKPKGKASGKRWEHQGKKRTLDELQEFAVYGLTKTALRFRLESGWEIERALSTEPMSRAEAGLMGAKVTNKQA